MIQETSPNSLGDSVLERVIRILNYPFVNQTEFRVSILSLLLLAVVVFVAALVSRYVRRLLDKRVLPMMHMEAGLRHTLLRLVHYAIIVFGVLYGQRK